LLEAEEIAKRSKQPTSQFWAKNYLCKAYGYKLELDKTIETFSESVKLFNPNEMQEGVDNVLAYNFLGIALTRTGKSQEGETYLQKSLALIEKIKPDDEVFIAIIKNSLGENLLAQNKFDEAKPLIEDTYPIIKAKLGDGHKNTVGALKRLVALYEKTNNTELAGKYRDQLPK
jgi:tetratricopeptide (TPR) repeat protein